MANHNLVMPLQLAEEGILILHRSPMRHRVNLLEVLLLQLPMELHNRVDSSYRGLVDLVPLVALHTLSELAQDPLPALHIPPPGWSLYHHLQLVCRWTLQDSVGRTRDVVGGAQIAPCDTRPVDS